MQDLCTMQSRTPIRTIQMCRPTFSATMYLLLFSLARYTLPNLPLPSGLPMSKSDNCHRRSLDAELLLALPAATGWLRLLASLLGRTGGARVTLPVLLPLPEAPGGVTEAFPGRGGGGGMSAAFCRFDAGSELLATGLNGGRPLGPAAASIGCSAGRFALLLRRWAVLTSVPSDRQFSCGPLQAPCDAACHRHSIGCNIRMQVG